jgi:hypothetical protein
MNMVPTALQPFYGSRTPVGLAVFLRLRPMQRSMPMDHDTHEIMDMSSRHVVEFPIVKAETQ